MFWRITRDFLADPTDAADSRTGYGFGDKTASAPFITFTLYDDDGECYYAGICDREAFENDMHADGLYGAYQWAMHDAGCTDLQVNGESIYG